MQYYLLTKFLKVVKTIILIQFLEESEYKGEEFTDSKSDFDLENTFYYENTSGI